MGRVFYTKQTIGQLGCFVSLDQFKEWDGAARFELQHHPHPPTCMFADISGFLNPSVAYILKDLQSTDRLMSDLKPLIESNKGIRT